MQPEPHDMDEQFADAYRTHHDFVVRAIRRRGIPANDAEDAAQEVFLVLHQRFHSLDHDSSLRAWLHSVVVRVCSNRRRKFLRDQAAGAPGAEYRDPDTLAEALVHDVPMQSELRSSLASALELLDERKRQVLLLSAIENHTAAEIAELIKVSPNTVASRLRAARQHLAPLLKAVGDDRKTGE